jgi:hypothetical protein
MALSPLSATNFYIDATNGDDANDGLTPATAWQTLLSIQAANFNPTPGDSILLKRGEVWRNDPLQINFIGKVDLPLIFSHYGSVTDSLPLITSVDILPGSSNPMNWTEVSPDLWSMELDFKPFRLLLEGQEVLRGNTEAGLGILDSEGAFSKWFWRTRDNTLFLHEMQNPAIRYGESITGNVEFVSMLALGARHIVLDGLEFAGGASYSAAIISSDSLVVKNCKIGRFANRGMWITGDDFGEGFLTSSYVEVLDNIFDSGFTIYHGPGTIRGCADGLYLFAFAENCTISGNIFRNWAGNSIELICYSSNVGGVNNNLIKENYISAPDISFSRGISANGPEGRCEFNRFVRNTIDSTRAGNFFNGNNNVFEHNIIRTVRQSPAENSGSAYGVIMMSFFGDFVCHDNDLDHNLVLDTDEAAILITKGRSTEPPTDNRLRNNIFYNNALEPYDDFYPAGPSLFIYEEGLGPHTYQNNIFFDEAGSASQVFLSASNELLTAAAFNARNGTGNLIISDNLNEDPDFIDPAAGNYTSTTIGGSVDAGLDLGYLEDFVLAERNQGAAPDIGPFESSMELPSELTTYTAEALGKTTVELNWNTISETASERFHVERKSDHRFWTEIGSVAAAGFSRSSLDYSFTDQEAPAGTLYYRLRQVDLDDSYTYSPIRKIILSTDVLDLRWLDHRTAEVQLPNDRKMSDATASFYSIDGRNLSLTVSENRLQFSENLPAGVYLLIIDGEVIRVSLH